ncbi:MAG: iron-only hydrogenase system regulator [Lachnospiraceae bacterium]|jgi:putative iron-only hydrogenase system regulator|nr:iron-only hydrogenase system regulator [Lachnospiraceae bacterium]
MSKRVALLSIIVSDKKQISKLNEYLHEASDYIIGRMGIPYRERNINIISIAVDAPQDFISALSGKIGKLEGVASRTTYSDVITEISGDGK